MQETAQVRNGSANLSVADVGSGTPVVLLHAGVADKRSWETIAERLHDTCRLVAYDRRGFGSTTYEEEPHTSIADLEAVLDALQIGAALIVGNSMGGMLAVDFALLHPDRVLGLVLVAASIHGTPYPDGTSERVTELESEIERLEKSGDLDGVNELEAELWLDGPDRSAGTVGGAERELFLDMNRRALEALPTGEVGPDRPASAWDRLGEMDAPTVVVAGRHDLPEIVAVMGTAATVIPGARHETYPGSAHLPQLDDPDRLAQTIADLVRQVEAS